MEVSSEAKTKEFCFLCGACAICADRLLPRMISLDKYCHVLYNVSKNFCKGEMIAADCAEILCEEFVYKLKG